MNQILTPLADSLSTSWQQIAAYAPTFLLSITIILVGLFIASVLYIITFRFLRLVAIDDWTDRTPLFRFLRTINITISLSRIVAVALFWVTMGMVAILFINAVMPQYMGQFVALVTTLLPRFILGILCIAIAFVIANIAAHALQKVLQPLQIIIQPILVRTVYILSFAAVLLFLLYQFGLTVPFFSSSIFILTICTLIFLATAGLIVFYPYIVHYSAQIHLQKTLPVGSTVHIDSISGTVRGFTSLSVIIHHQKGNTLVPAGRFFTSVYTIDSL